MTTAAAAERQSESRNRPSLVIPRDSAFEAHAAGRYLGKYLTYDDAARAIAAANRDLEASSR
ncbi:hypothetical protein [Devosia sp.]|uniref:hypothetical protein n=1 Tax=Devosia sp. TaxID=1871048 RepID=UPI0035B4843B